MKTNTRYALIAGALFLSLSGLAWWAYRRFFRDGIGPTGRWDDEGGFADAGTPEESAVEPTYSQVQIPLRHFHIREFDSPDAPGSGGAMKIRFLQMLDAAREQAGIPFIVNSGYRTPAHNAAVGGVPNSAHLHGWAADISARTPEQHSRILQAARAAGFNRFGIYDTFIHLDCDPGKRGDVVWDGKGVVERGGDFSGRGV